MKEKTFYSERPEEIQVEPVPGGSIAYLRENIEEVQTAEGETQYSADEYSVASQHSPDRLLDRITKDFASWLEYAKEQETMVGEDDLDTLDLLELAADHEERICMLELGV